LPARHRLVQDGLHPIKRSPAGGGSGIGQVERLSVDRDQLITGDQPGIGCRAAQDDCHHRDPIA
jgi:hypothetical protein